MRQMKKKPKLNPPDPMEELGVNPVLEPGGGIQFGLNGMG